MNSANTNSTSCPNRSRGFTCRTLGAIVLGFCFGVLATWSLNSPLSQPISSYFSGEKPLGSAGGEAIDSQSDSTYRLATRPVSPGEYDFWKEKTVLLLQGSGREEIALAFKRFCQERGIIVACKALASHDIPARQSSHPNQVFNCHPKRLPFAVLKSDIVEDFFVPSAVHLANNRQGDFFGWDVLVVCHDHQPSDRGMLRNDDRN